MNHDAGTIMDVAALAGVPMVSSHGFRSCPETVDRAAEAILWALESCHAERCAEAEESPRIREQYRAFARFARERSLHHAQKAGVAVA